MFTGRTNRPLRPDNVTDRFNKLATAAGVRAIGPHQVRHMLASSLLDSGYGVHEVAERLGHDAATLMRYYTRVNASRRAQAAGDAAALVTATPWENDGLWQIPQQDRPWSRERARSTTGRRFGQRSGGVADLNVKARNETVADTTSPAAASPQPEFTAV